MCHVWLNAIAAGREMRAAIVLLPFLLPETAISCLSEKKRKRRTYFKPSVVESQEWFIDLQKVNICTTGVHYSLYAVLFVLLNRKYGYAASFCAKMIWKFCTGKKTNVVRFC